MTDFRRLLAPDTGEAATTIHMVDKAGLDLFQASLCEVARTAIQAANFKAAVDTALFLPSGNGKDWSAVVGLGDGKIGRWTLAAALNVLPEGKYRLSQNVPAVALHGWLMGQHHFTRYRKTETERGPRQLLISDPALIEAALAEAQITAALRDMVNTPAEDFGPSEVEQAIRELAEASNAKMQVVSGDALLEQNFPAIHAVGRASNRKPRLISMQWGNPAHPLVAIVGKGVCFDTGGLNLKPGGSMALMKKDMGGAAHAIALAKLVIAKRLKVRIHLVVAAVDNAVAGNAMRPGDVLATRKGLSVEVGNTDAEGRLILADALTFAGESQPELVLDFATLTGAARVALGPDLPPVFANDDILADGLLDAGLATDDPMWRLPLWQGYHRLFKSDIADLNNNSDSGFAGSIVAALFLESFVPPATNWAHIDLYAWNPTPKPGRPKGGAAMAVFAAAHYLESRYK